ncbi:dihydroxy-acid dehydratase [Gracilibacillus boraciitolerans JCM 21714]|uniref:Dihydroxy-acid dehydratase n=1 Tax=Gracilibacillus boraciitolerans JCM 21714 TaxID=1298598 RepID=W4VHR0_9BACI|nr:dihydroxy-acid dehydratase [Gracilibacillus boraciitolerans JCM 21714]
MLHLRDLGLIRENIMTVTGHTMKENLDWWEHSERRQKMKQKLKEADQIDADEVIMSKEKAKERGLTSTVTFPTGNIAPEGAVIKSTSIDPSRLDKNQIYYHKSTAKVFTSEASAIEAIKTKQIKKGDIMILTGCGPLGTGMEETYQVTSALKHLSYGKYVTLITDARFSGVSTGACIGHVGPEGLADGPIGKLQDGDLIEVRIDAKHLEGSINFIGHADQEFSSEEGARVLASRKVNPNIQPAEKLPDDTRLWAALQKVSGGTWKGSVYDVDRIVEVLAAGEKALKEK